MILFRFSQNRFYLSWIYLSWIFPFRWQNSIMPIGKHRFLRDDILNITQPAMSVTEPVPGKIPMLFQFLDRAADRIHPIFTDMRQALRRIVPLIR